MMRRLGLCLAFGVGFLSLSLEILWVRLVTFVHQGVPQSFAFVLGIFLFGIAFGAVLGKRICMRWPEASQIPAGMLLLLAGGIDMLTPQIVASASMDGQLTATMGILVFVSSALKASAFPVAHHVGSTASGLRLGRSISEVYFTNIVGSTLGTLVAGYLMLELVSTSGAFVLVGVLTMVMGVAALCSSRPKLFVPFLLVAAGGLSVTDLQDHSLIVAASSNPYGRVKAVVENRHGIVHTVEGGKKGDIVYGGNVYDGRTNIDLRTNSNRVDRLYLLAALHPAPKRVLVIGLSTGAWVRILSAFPALEHMDVVEINPGYLKVISEYEHLAPILEDRRIRMHIDDGRRWLRRHPAEKYDLIVMNTTFHWRASITNLLSKEFMNEVHDHLRPGGLLAFNTTGSVDALAAAASVFPYVFRWSNFAYASDHDFSLLPDDVVERYSTLGLLDLNVPEDKMALKKMLETPFSSMALIRAESGREPEIITDDNMISEFKYGRRMRFE